jgi:PhnB protein
MSTVLNPYISFRGTAREAMEFYQSVFGGDLTVTTFGEYNLAKDPSEAEMVMHASLTGETGLMLMASDVPDRMDVTFGNNIQISLGGDDHELLTGWYEKLVVDGKVLTPLATSEWGDTFGQFVDRYGVTWLVNIAAQGRQG